MYHYNRQSRSGGDGGSRHRRDRGGVGRQRHRSNQRGRSRSRSRSDHRYSNNNNNNNSGDRNNNNRIRDRSNIRQRYSTRSPSSSGQWRRNESHGGGGSSGDRCRNNRRRCLSCSPSPSGRWRRNQSHGADDSYYRHGGTSNRSNRCSRRGSRSYSSSSDDSCYRRGGTSNRRYRSPRRGRRGSRSLRSSDSSPSRGRENATREAIAQSALHLRGGLNPALGLGLPGLTDAQGCRTESQQLIRAQQLIRNQQPSSFDQLMAQNKSLDGLKSNMPSIEQLLAQNKSPDDLKPTVLSTEQLLAQVNADYAINSRASTGQPYNLFESATNLDAMVGNDLVGNNQPRKPLGNASALNNLIQGSVQCFNHNGYGWISPADGSKDVFFHCNQVSKVSIKSCLIGGDIVTFNKEFDSRRKKWYATNVTLSLPPKPPLEVGTNIPPTTSSNTGDEKKSKKQNYDGDDDDDGYSGDDEN